MSGTWRKIIFNNDILSVYVSGFRYSHDLLKREKSQKVPSCVQILSFSIERTDEILGFLALELLIQKCRSRNLSNDFIQILSQCYDYNIGINEQYIFKFIISYL